MKKTISVLAIIGLTGCIEGGSNGGNVDLTPDVPDVQMNADFGTLLNGARMDNATYDPRLGRAVQDHANDMFDRGYLAVTIPGTTGNNNGMEDIGDRVTQEGYNWASIAQLVAEGDFTMEELLADFNSVPCGNAGQDECITSSVFQDFGIGKAGEGDGQKWALVLTEPG